MTGRLKVGDRELGPGLPVFVIAEAGSNHNGESEMAHRLIEAAAAAGVDAVKFQTFKARRLYPRSAGTRGAQAPAITSRAKRPSTT